VYDKLRLLLAASCCYNGVGCAPALERTMGGGGGWIKYPNTGRPYCCSRPLVLRHGFLVGCFFFLSPVYWCAKSSFR